MFKKLTMGLGTFLIVGVLALFTVGSVFAQAPTPTPQTPVGNASGRIIKGAGVVFEAITKLLGMTPKQIFAEGSAGQTLADIAKAKGISDQQLIDAMLAGRKEVVDQALKDNRITQVQADWMLEKMKTIAPLMINNQFGPGGTDGLHAGGRGRRGNHVAPGTAATPPAK